MPMIILILMFLFAGLFFYAGDFDNGVTVLTGAVVISFLAAVIAAR